MRLVAMDTDELADGSGKAPMTWVADELLQSEYYFTGTGEGGWEASLMRSWLRGIVLPLFPEEVRSGIREVTKSSYVSEEGEGFTTKDTIWIPSMMEVAFSDKLESIGEERKYYSEERLQWLSSMWDSEYEAEKVAYTEWFKDKSSRVRTRTGESEASWWYLRSVYNFDNENYFKGIFSAVDTDGSILFGDDADDMGGVLIGFCL